MYVCQVHGPTTGSSIRSSKTAPQLHMYVCMYHRPYHHSSSLIAGYQTSIVPDWLTNGSRPSVPLTLIAARLLGLHGWCLGVWTSVPHQWRRRRSIHWLCFFICTLHWHFPSAAWSDCFRGVLFCGYIINSCDHFLTVWQLVIHFGATTQENSGRQRLPLKRGVSCRKCLMTWMPQDGLVCEVAQDGCVRTYVYQSAVCGYRDVSRCGVCV